MELVIKIDLKFSQKHPKTEKPSQFYCHAYHPVYETFHKNCIRLNAIIRGRNMTLECSMSIVNRIINFVIQRKLAGC